MAVLITGGARSGKSAFAEQYASYKGEQGYYLATSMIYDAEMEERAEKHRRQRDHGNFHWKTIEEPVHLTKRLREIEKEAGSAAIVLIDCLTVWLSNVLFSFALTENEDGSTKEAGNEDIPANIEQAYEMIEELARCAEQFSGTLIFVTNEVGDGIVPTYQSGRIFRDVSGKMNQRLAASCEEVFLVTAGIPVELKQIRYQFDAEGLKD